MKVAHRGIAQEKIKFNLDDITLGLWYNARKIKCNNIEF